MDEDEGPLTQEEAAILQREQRAYGEMLSCGTWCDPPSSDGWSPG